MKSFSSSNSISTSSTNIYSLLIHMLLSMCRVTMDNLIVPPARFGWNFKAKVNSFVWTTDQSIECIDRNKIGRWQSAHMHTESTRGWLLSLLPTLLLLHLIESIVFLCLSHSSLPVTLSLSLELLSRSTRPACCLVFVECVTPVQPTDGHDE